MTVQRMVSDNIFRYGKIGEQVEVLRVQKNNRLYFVCCQRHPGVKLKFLMKD